MDLKIINAKHFIVSMAPDQMPEELKEDTLLFYFPRRDAIVLNEESRVFEPLCEIVESYLELGDKERKKCMDMLGTSKVDAVLLDVDRVLNRVLRIRRRLYRKGRN